MSKYSTPYTGPVGHVGMAERRRICESVVGSVEWNEGGIWGYCACPGLQHHTNHNARRDCRVYAAETPGGARNGGALPPGATCVHSSCRGAIEAASYRIRSEIGRAKVAAAGPKTAGQKSVSVADSEASRTPRTPVFKFSEKGAIDSRTVRTDISRPYALHAHVRAHTHVPAIPENLPSEPSEVAHPGAAGVAPIAPKEQPTAELNPMLPPSIAKSEAVDITHIEGDRSERGYYRNGEWVTTRIIN